MTAVEIREAIGKLQTKVAELEEVRSTRDEILARALCADQGRYDESRVREAKRQKAVVEDQLSILMDRIGALEAQLPSAEAIRQATIEADALIAEVQSGFTRFGEATTTYVAAVEQVEDAVRTLTALSQATRIPIARLRDLVPRFGLNVTIPNPPSLPPQHRKVTWLVGQAVCEMADGEPDLGSLNAARAEQPRTP